MVKFETRRDAEVLVKNPSPRRFGKKFRDSKKVKTNHAKKRLRDLSKTLPRFRDPAKIFPDPRFSWCHPPPLIPSVYPVQRHGPMGVPPGFSCCLADSSCRLEDRASYLFISLCFSDFGASLCNSTKTKTTKTKTRH